jgi:hypothetical protein
MVSRNIRWCAFYRKKNLFSIVLSSFIILELVILIPASSTPVVEWSKTFGEAGNGEVAISVVQTADGGYIIAGKQLLFKGDDVTVEKALLIKTDVNGNKMWIRTFGEIGGSGNEVNKNNENGNSMWSMLLGGGKNYVASSVLQTEDDSYLIAGTTESYVIELHVYGRRGKLKPLMLLSEK